MKYSIFAPPFKKPNRHSKFPMKKVLSLVSAFMLLLQVAFAQAPNYNPSSVLFTLSNEKVTAGEFVKVYQKTNVSGEADFSEKSLRDYLDLYVNFRLKVKEARDM